MTANRSPACASKLLYRPALLPDALVAQHAYFGSSPAEAAVTLDGSPSSDPDSDPLTFFWSAPGITFDNPTSATPTATFPLGSTTVTLTVTDPGGLTDRMWSW